MNSVRRWEPITEFVNGSVPDETCPPEYRIHAGGDIEIRGACKVGIEGEPCARLPEEARPKRWWSQAEWWGHERENFRRVEIVPEGYVTIIQATKYELARHYLESLS